MRKRARGNASVRIAKAVFYDKTQRQLCFLSFP